MSESQRARVFHPFNRSSDPAFGAIPGAGLGLYVSRQLAEANQGRLTLERSEPGLGTCFALNLPLAKPEPVKETRLPAVDVRGGPSLSR